MAQTIITYGAGEILRNVFNAVAILMNNQTGSLVKPLMIICASLGAIWFAGKAMFSQSTLAFFNGYILPLIAITFLFMIPTSSVHVEDILKNTSYKIDHVPFLLAKVSELTSSLGYQITTAFEKVMHVPNDLSYNTTGMLFGSENALDINRYEITNGDLQQNLRRFCKQCVLYDITQGRYSIDELKKASDLWKFFEEKTSKVRMIQFTSLSKDEGEMGTSYVSCKKAIEKMTPFFESEKRFYAQQAIFKNLPLTFQAITGIQKDKEELISQQLMMQVLSSEYSGNKFAKGRAYTQQKSTYQILGGLASNSLITLRGFLEALVYSAFVLILPLSLLPQGVKFITSWLSIVVWIQLWPPFYAILNYIMQIAAHGYAEGIFSGLNPDLQGLSFFTSIGIKNLQEDIFAMSGYLAASIPFITYAILKGGVSSFIHLAGSIMSPAQNAASSAASEQATGNYSFANTSFGQASYHNTSALQTQTAPSLSSGYFSENTGNYSIVHSPNGNVLNQSNSSLRTSFFSDDSISQSLQESKQHALSTVETSQKNYSESLGAASREFSDITKHLGNSSNYSENISEREAFDIQESARYLQNTAENWGKQYGINARESLDLLTQAGVGGSFFVTASIDGKYNLGASKDEALNSALTVSKSEDFQKHLQNIQDFSETKAHSFLKDEGVRHADSFNHSLETVRNSQESFQAAQSELNQVSENSSWLKQNSQSIKDSLNQEFVNYYAERFATSGGVHRLEDILSNGSPQEKQHLINEFFTHIRTQAPLLEQPSKFSNPETAYHTSNIPKIDPLKESPQREPSLNSETFGLRHGEIQEKLSELTNRFNEAKSKNKDSIQSMSNRIESKQLEAVENLTEENNKYLWKHVPKAAFKTDKYLGSFQLKEAPFWMKGGEE